MVVSSLEAFLFIYFLFFYRFFTWKLYHVFIFLFGYYFIILCKLICDN